MKNSGFIAEIKRRKSTLDNRKQVLLLFYETFANIHFSLICQQMIIYCKIFMFKYYENLIFIE